MLEFKFVGSTLNDTSKLGNTYVCLHEQKSRINLSSWA